MTLWGSVFPYARTQVSEHSEESVCVLKCHTAEEAISGASGNLTELGALRTILLEAPGRQT